MNILRPKHNQKISNASFMFLAVDVACELWGPFHHKGWQNKRREGEIIHQAMVQIQVPDLTSKCLGKDLMSTSCYQANAEDWTTI